MKGYVIVRIVLGAVLVVVLWVSCFVIAYTDRGFICENSGSRMGYREWCFGIRTNEWQTTSKLEEFMRDQHPSVFEHRWTSYKGTGRSLIPCVMRRGHGRPGPIMHLPIGLLDERVTALSGPERLAMYEVFSGCDDAACAVLVDRMISDDF
ncbi:MAG: hypothetical protein ACQKBU_11125 [Verrucomicrobiales bacterium]|nr:hypothetical protein [Verrucomicrobiota bacterium JB025]